MRDARCWRLSHGHLQSDSSLGELNSHQAVCITEAGQKWSITGGKAQKSYGHNQSSADKEACDPVFPPIRPGKADYSIPGLFLALSLSHSPSIVAGGQGLLFLEMCVHVIWLVLFNASEEWATIVTVWPFSLPLSGPVFDLKWQSQACCCNIYFSWRWMHVQRWRGELCLLIWCPRAI